MIKKISKLKEGKFFAPKTKQWEKNLVLFSKLSETVDVIREIIDVLNEDEYAMSIKTELPSLEDCKKISFSDLPGKHDKQEEKQSWQKKLEEADKLEIISLKAKDILSSFEKESIWQLKECNKFKIDLYKQVISELIKENEWYKNQVDVMNDCNYELNNKYLTLQQKQPDKIMKQLLKDMKEKEKNKSGFYLTKVELRELLKYFKEIR